VLTRGLLVAAGVVGASLLTTPAQAAPMCSPGQACLTLNRTDGGTTSVRFALENWVNVGTFPAPGFTLTNSQVSGDDACVADGPAGTGNILCVPAGESLTRTAFTVRSFRG
jgi:hypothetical protein